MQKRRPAVVLLPSRLMRRGPCHLVHRAVNRVSFYLHRSLQTGRVDCRKHSWHKQGALLGGKYSDATLHVGQYEKLHVSVVGIHRLHRDWVMARVCRCGCIMTIIRLRRLILCGVKPKRWHEE